MDPRKSEIPNWVGGWVSLISKNIEEENGGPSHSTTPTYAASAALGAVPAWGCSGFKAINLQTGMAWFSLRSCSDGWTSTSRRRTRSPMSSFPKSTSTLGGMWSLGQRYFMLGLILCRNPPG